MPTHKIHLAIAKKVSDELKLDLDSVMLGSILPDIHNEKNHKLYLAFPNIYSVYRTNCVCVIRWQI